MTERNDWALIGDIKASKTAADRDGLQKTLERALANANGRLHPAARLDVTVGDEFEGLFHRPGPAIDAVLSLTDALHPYRVSFGVGYGPLATALRPEHVARLDGPCFHHAREAILQAKKEDSWVAFRGLGREEDELHTRGFRLMWAFRSQWTARQREYIQHARKGETLEAIGARFGVTKSAVSQSLSAASYDEVMRYEWAAKDMLEKAFPRPLRFQGPGRTSQETHLRLKK